MTSSPSPQQRLTIPKCFSKIGLKKQMAALASNSRSDVCHLSRLSEVLLREVAGHIRRDQDTLSSLVFVSKQFRNVVLSEAYEKVVLSGFKSLKTFTRVLRPRDTFPKKKKKTTSGRCATDCWSLDHSVFEDPSTCRWPLRVFQMSSRILHWAFLSL
jgi:hypothetical protein